MYNLNIGKDIFKYVFFWLCFFILKMIKYNIIRFYRFFKNIIRLYNINF